MVGNFEKLFRGILGGLPLPHLRPPIGVGFCFPGVPSCPNTAVPPLRTDRAGEGIWAVPKIENISFVDEIWGRGLARGMVRPRM